MTEKKKKNGVSKISRAYQYESVHSSDILKLAKLFPSENIFIEIINIKADSSFCEKIKSQKEKFIFSLNSSKIYTDIFITESLKEDFSDLLNEIIQNTPEMLLLYFTDLQLEHFLYNSKRSSDDKMIEKHVSACVFEIIFEENTFLISYNSKVFNDLNLIPKIDKILIND